MIRPRGHGRLLSALLLPVPRVQMVSTATAWSVQAHCPGTHTLLMITCFFAAAVPAQLGCPIVALPCSLPAGVMLAGFVLHPRLKWVVQHLKGDKVI